MGPKSKLSFQLNCVADLGEYCEDVELGASIKEMPRFIVKLLHSRVKVNKGKNVTCKSPSCTVL